MWSEMYYWMWIVGLLLSPIIAYLWYWDAQRKRGIGEVDSELNSKCPDGVGYVVSNEDLAEMIKATGELCVNLKNIDNNIPFMCASSHLLKLLTVQSARAGQFVMSDPINGPGGAVHPNTKDRL